MDDLENFDASGELLTLAGQLFDKGFPCFFIDRSTDVVPENSTRFNYFEVFF